MEECGPTDVLIANAGIARETPVETYRAEDFADQINANLIGVSNSMAVVLPGMRERRRGHLVVLSSLASYRGLPWMAGYCASKAIVDALRVAVAILQHCGDHALPRLREATLMDRRTFLKTAASGAIAASGYAMPAISQRASARTLRFVPQADLSNFDPIWNTQYVVRNGAALIWDMLYGVDENLQPRRQIVEAEEVAADGLT